MNDQVSEASVDDDWAAAMEEQGDTEPKKAEQPEEKAGYEKAEFSELDKQAGSHNSDEANLDVILDIPVSLSMEIGRTEITINDLLQLSQGSVVELDRLAGESMDVMVNGTLIAHGEVVVVDEKFGIRLTDVISPTERIRKLK